MEPTPTKLSPSKLTWTKAGLWTLLVLFISLLLSSGMTVTGVFLAPPMFKYTLQFYILLVLLPSLFTFLICVARRPRGERFMLVALPLILSVTICGYLLLTGPGYFNDIQCLPRQAAQASRQLECQCRFVHYEGTAQYACLAEDLAPFPFIRLIEVHWGGR